jgi:hypothetical protein
MVYHELCQIIPVLNQKNKSSKATTFGIASFSIPFCQKDRPKSQWAAATQVLCPQPQSCRRRFGRPDSTMDKLDDDISNFTGFLVMK